MTSVSPMVAKALSDTVGILTRSPYDDTKKWPDGIKVKQNRTECLDLICRHWKTVVN